MKRNRRNRRTSALSGRPGLRRLSGAAASTAALLVAAPLLSGCATDSHPGAAAVVGGERITVAEVQSQVEAVRDAQREQDNADDLIARSSSLTRDTVNFLVIVELVERAAEENGVTVSRREVQENRDQVERSVGGAEALRQSALMPASGMPLAGEQIDMVLRRDLLIQGLADKIGAGPGPDGQAKLIRLLSETSEEIGVEVNPRYGEWDPKNVRVGDADTPWLRVFQDAADRLQSPNS